MALVPFFETFTVTGVGAAAGIAAVTGGISNSLVVTLAATRRFGTFALPEPEITAVAFSAGQLTVTVTRLGEVEVASPVRSHAGGLRGWTFGSSSKVPAGLLVRLTTLPLVPIESARS